MVVQVTRPPERKGVQAKGPKVILENGELREVLEISGDNTVERNAHWRQLLC